MKKVSIIIPSFNGRSLLAEGIPALFAALGPDPAGIGCEVIVVDDGSTDGSADLVAGKFPGVKLVRLDRNYGFSCACNAGAGNASGDILYFLNSDIKVSPGFLGPLVRHFSDEDVFAVSSVEEPDPSSGSARDEGISITFVKFKYGIFWYWYEAISKKDYLTSGSHGIEVFCVSGGHTAYDKKKYLALGRFDTLFSPFYAEDGDICWRAWKHGWKSLIEPQSVVKHECQSTISKLYSRSQIQSIHWKNRLLMVWKDLASARLWLKHLFFIIPEVLICPFIGKAELSKGFFLSLKQIPELLRSRRRDRVEKEVYSDRWLFERFSSAYRFPPVKILYMHETGSLGGAENSLLNLAANLDRKKFTPIFACPADGLLAESLTSLGVKVYPMEFPRIRNIRGVRTTLKKIRKIMRDEKVGLIHSNSIRTHIYAAAAAHLEGVPVVWHQRNLIDKEVIDPDRALSFVPDAIVCNSEAIAKRFARHGRIPGNVRTIYNGVDLKLFNPMVNGDRARGEFGIAKDQIVIGIASRFSRNKGHETFLSAAAKLLKEIPGGPSKLRFLIAGGAVFAEDLEREKVLRDLCASMGLGDRAIFTGFRTEMPEVYAMMDIFVLASDAEPCGRVLFEAMASGKAIVATNTGGTPEIVSDGITAILVAPRDPDATAAAIKTLIEDPARRLAFARAGRARAEEMFGIEKNVRKTEELYSRLLKL